MLLPNATRLCREILPNPAPDFVVTTLAQGIVYRYVEWVCTRGGYALHEYHRTDLVLDEVLGAVYVRDRYSSALSDSRQ